MQLSYLNICCKLRGSSIFCEGDDVIMKIYTEKCTGNLIVEDLDDGLVVVPADTYRSQLQKITDLETELSATRLIYQEDIQGLTSQVEDLKARLGKYE